MKFFSDHLKRLATPFWLALSILVLFASTLLAQETTGGLQGTIKDPSGAVVVGAHVTVTSTALVGTKESTTDSGGFYHFSNLPPGTYTVVVKAQGFDTSKREKLQIDTGHQLSLNFALSLGTVNTVVEVSTDAPVIDVTTTQNLTNVTNEALQNLPTGTSFQSVIQFAPMARNEPLAGVGASTGNNGNGGSMPGSSSNGRSSGYSIGGAADSESSYLVEGQDTESISGGYSKADVPMEFIQEVQVKTSGISAEFGGALGGVVNVVLKKGSDEFHGGLFTTYQTSAADANQNQTLLRYDPTDSGTATQDPASQNYQRKQDSFLNMQPGMTFGGPIVKNKLWFFTGFAPMISTLSRTVDFSAADPTDGKLNFTQQNQTYFSNARLDYAATKKIRIFGSWMYQLSREMGDTLPIADPIASQSTYVNESINSPLSSYSHEYGYSAPNATYNFGADATLTQKLVSTTRFGYFFENYHDFGWPTSGVDFVWIATGTGANGNDGKPLPSDLQQDRGASTTPYTGTFTLFNASKHIQLNQDFSYFRSGRWGTHNLKAGYELNHLSNVISQNGNVPYVRVKPGNGFGYSANTTNGVTNCNSLKAEWGHCTGEYGYAYAQDFATVLTTPAVDWNHAFYAQDSWTIGHGVTLDLGLRIEKESLPAPDGSTVSAIDFQWSDKIEPRLGVAWDPTGKGKMKAFGSYGVVNDVMKLLLAQTSWGAQAYEDCVYPLGPTSKGGFALSDLNFAFKGGRACPSAAANVGANFATSGTPAELTDSKTNVSLIENMNWRPWEPVAPNVKPYRQHEFVAGFDYQIKPGYAFEVRYDRRRLDHVIEDASLSDVNWGETYAVVNPGEGVNSTLNGYATYLASLGEAFGVPGYIFDAKAFGTCTNCPANPKAVRNYDGLEMRLSMTPSPHWTATVSYTYSSLWGNYTGLTTTDQSDGGESGRNSPDTSRAFDEPFYYFKADGTSSNGPLPTDRPNTFKANAYYAHPWNRQHTTTIGLFQNVLEGSPVSSFIDLASAGGNPLEATYLYGRGQWVDVTANNNTEQITLGTPYARRTPWFLQSDLNLSHEVKMGEHKTLKLVFVASNAFNQHSVTAYWEGIDSNNAATPLDPINPTTGVGVTLADGASAYQTLENKYNPTAVINGANQVMKSSQYGQPDLYQTPRSTRFEVHFAF
jgi:hypothetical protein